MYSSLIIDFAIMKGSMESVLVYFFIALRYIAFLLAIYRGSGRQIRFISLFSLTNQLKIFCTRFVSGLYRYVILMFVFSAAAIVGLQFSITVIGMALIASFAAVFRVVFALLESIFVHTPLV